MKLHRVFLLLGSNLGDRVLHIQHAIDSIQLRISNAEKISSLYETEPWGVTDQPNYLNAVMVIHTSDSPEKLLSLLKQIELEEGRTDQRKYASRTLDIDILLYDDLIFNSKDLIIPHPRLQERKFVLIPLNEIASEIIHPVFKKSIAQLLNECGDMLDVWKFPQ